MGAHAKTIRHAVVDGLTPIFSTGGAGAVVDGRVFGNRFRPLGPNELPSIRVYTQKEFVETEGGGPRLYSRELEVVVEIICSEPAGTPADRKHFDQPDELAELVEGWFFDNECLENVWQYALLTEVEAGLVTEGQKPIAAHRLKFDVTYEDRAPRTPATLEDFETAHVEIDTAPADTSTESVDDVPVPTN